MHPSTVAEGIQDLEPEEIVDVLRYAPREACSEILRYLETNVQARVVDLCHLEEVAGLLEGMPPDDRIDLFKQMSPETQERVLRAAPPDEREDMLRLAAYREETAGALMTTRFVTVRPWEMVTEAIASVRGQAAAAEIISISYVLDDDDVLVGVVSLRELMLAADAARIADIMHRDLIVVHVGDDQEEVARTIHRHDLAAVPVVDSDGRLIGTVTADDAMEVEEDEATEDFHKMGSVTLMETSLRDAGIWLLYRTRMPWLLALVFMNVFSGAAIARFEETIEAYMALVFFLPLLIDSSGNAGSQAATLVVRALATGDLGPRDWLRMIEREMLVVVPLGVTMALGAMLIAAVRAPEVLVPVGLAMVSVVAFGSLMGVTLPFILTKLRLDPAAASTPLITSLADIGSVIIYFGIATWYLGIG